MSTISNWADPVHDDAGNMTTIPQPLAPSSSSTLKYDAWNRLVEVKDGPVVQANEYDGLNRRIVKMDKAANPDVTYDYYYNRQWQVLEVRKNGSANPEKQYVYHQQYVDAVAVRYYDENTNGAGIVSHYYLQDANFNVTAVTDSAGAVVERYAYTPYGEVSFLASDFSPLTSSSISNEYLYTGRRRDPETGLQLNRNRFYASHLGRWVNRDPIGYWGSEWNLYEYVKSTPLGSTDPTGLVPCAPFPLGCPPSPVNCSHYKCLSPPSIGCALIAKVEFDVCLITPNAPWSNCVRACLQRCQVKNSWMLCAVTFTFCHDVCYTSCAGNTGAPAY